MAVTFILGRAGTGKTRSCLDAIVARLADAQAQEPMILIVPEQASFEMERALAGAAPRGAFHRAQVLSFTRLARRVQNEFAQPSAVLTSSARELALRAVLAAHPSLQRAFGRATQARGFYRQLATLVHELVQECTTPEQIEAAAARLADGSGRRRAEALAGVLRAYRDWLGPQRTDPADLLTAVRPRLPDVAWIRGARVWVDGFAGFTRVEEQTLVALARAAIELVITLLVDPDLPQPAATSLDQSLRLFRRTEETFTRLSSVFREAGIAMGRAVRLDAAPPPRFAAAPALAAIEAAFAGRTRAGPERQRPPGAGQLCLAFGESPAAMRAADPAPPSATEQDAASVVIVACSTQREELREAARWIRRGVSAAGGRRRFREYAVIARNVADFAPLIDEIFREYEIPHFLDQRRGLHTHVLSRLVADVLDACGSHFSNAALRRLVRNELAPLSRGCAERIENSALASGVRGFEGWSRAWPDLGASRAEQQRVRLMQALAPLRALTLAPQPPAARDWTVALHATLSRLRTARRLSRWTEQARREQAWETAELHRLAWESLCAVLDEIHDVLGDVPLSVRELAQVLEGALEQRTVGLAPPTLDQVLVGSIERSRHPDVSCVWIVGFNEGMFPARPADDDLLPAAERDALEAGGLRALRSKRQRVFDERLLAYIAMTRPARELRISYAAAGPGGAPLAPSPLLDVVRQAWPSVAVRAPDPDAPPTCIADVASLRLRGRTTGDVARRVEARCERLLSDVRWSQGDRARLERALRGLSYANTARTLDADAAARGGDAERPLRDASPTEIETYIQCPFQHFARYRLGLEPLRGPAPLHLEMGSLAHELLARAVSRALELRTAVCDISDEEWRRLLDESVREIAAAAPGRPAAPERPARTTFLLSVLVERTADVLLAQAARWRRGAFAPIACEQAFGAADDEGGWQAVRIDVRGGYAAIRGKIDRVDLSVNVDDRTAYVIVTDYKSRASAIRAPYLVQDRLALFTYLLATQRNLTQTAEPAAVFLAPLFPARRLDQRGDPLPPDVARMYALRPRGLLAAAAAPLLDRQLSTEPSPVAYMALRKDGGFNSTRSRDVISGHELRQRLRLAEETNRYALEGILAGDVAIAPLYEKRALACSRCDFAALCRFERRFNRPRIAERTLPLLGDAPEALSADGPLEVPS